MNLERWGWYSIALNLLLAALHALIAMRSGSLAVAAELLHNVVDLLSAVAVLVGLKLAARKSKAFPYGLYKVENLVAAGLAMMVRSGASQRLCGSMPGCSQPWWLPGSSRWRSVTTNCALLVLRIRRR
jgi:divalent metal cation (Fe/Co/Zn/Cd) transporter